MSDPEKNVEWVTKWLEGDASAEDLAELSRIDPEQRAKQLRVHANLGVMLEDPELRDRRLDRWLADLREKEREQFVTSIRDKVEHSRWRGRVLALAACMVLTAGLAWWVLRSGEPELYATVLRMENVSDVEGGMGQTGFGPGNDRLSFGSGLIELDLQGRGSMLVEGPAELRFLSADHSEISRGRLVMRATKMGIGYSVNTPRGKVVDRGTEFAVLVEDDGEVEAHVIDGEIEVMGEQGKGVKLRRDEALQLDRKEGKSIKADFGKFYTSLPPASPHSGYVYWNFDDDLSDGISAVEKEGVRSSADLRMKLRVTDGGSLPEVVKGIRGNGLYFDGVGAFAETEYRGVGGGNARTICFWIKVPEDFSKKQGFGVISWGQAHQKRPPGTVWQVSVNPWERDGPLGRIRVGVYHGAVVGTTDLRDGKWHHVGIVLFGGSRPDVGTHVMFYIDGKMEKISGRLLREVRTEVDAADHGIWLGRNLTYWDGGNEADKWGRFFRGELDEVFVSERALPQEEIIRLMNSGIPEQ
jgi:hypothetical protein